MTKDFFFYECHLERGMASEGDPGLFAATEVVRAACNANFQRNGFYLRSHPSSPHCYYKYAKLPKDGMWRTRIFPWQPTQPMHDRRN